MIPTYLLRAGALFTLAAVVAVGSPPVVDAQAAAPMVRTVPGYYRMMLGDFEVTVLSDGTVPLPVGQLLTNTAAVDVEAALAKSHLASTVETSVNAFLINTGTKLVLIDTGAATLFGPTLGKLVANLKAAGYRPEQIDEVYVTHLHPDHVGGLLTDGKMAFPNAIVRADKRESDFWLNQANLAKTPDALKGAFGGAMTSLKPYLDAGRFKPFLGDTELVPGVRSSASNGHTAGHSTYVVESKGRKLVLWGDLMHVAAVQFAHPDVTIQFDSDPGAAAAQRRRAYADAAKHGYLVGAAHLPFPGIGRIRQDGQGYDYLPVNYSALP